MKKLILFLSVVVFFSSCENQFKSENTSIKDNENIQIQSSNPQVFEDVTNETNY